MRIALARNKSTFKGSKNPGSRRAATAALKGLLEMKNGFVTLGAVLLASGAFIATPAVAQEAGDVQVKVVATGVFPDGAIEEVNVDLVGLPAGTQTEANDNVVPTLAVE